jgi:hypothetical protein
VRRLSRIGLALVATSCASLRYPAPATPDARDADRRVQRDERTAEHYHLPPDTFTSEARLARFDATQACFDVVLRVDEVDRDLASLDGWRITLQTPAGTPVTPRLAATLPVREEPARSPSGRDPPLQGRPGAACHGLQAAGYTFFGALFVAALLSSSRTPRWQNPRWPSCGEGRGGNDGTPPGRAGVQRVTGGGTVCFDHGCALASGVPYLWLVLSDPLDHTRRYVFRWDRPGYR